MVIDAVDLLCQEPYLYVKESNIKWWKKDEP